MSLMQVYLINLERRPDRLDKMTRQLDRLDVPFTRIAAVDARRTPDQELAKHFSDSGPLGVIPKGDKCCALSHVRAWKAFVASGDSHCVLLEDDVALDEDAAPLLRNADWIPHRVDLLKLERFGPTSQRVLLDARVPVSARHRIGRLLSRHTGAAAYILSRHGALSLLERAGPWALPVDHMLFNPNNSPVASILRPYQLTPAIAHQCEALGGCSDIGEWRAVLRQFDWTYAKRELYRAYFELRLLPQQILSVLRRECALVTVDERQDLPFAR